MNDRKKVSKLLFACQLAFATSFIPFTTAQAASIIWQAPVRITGDTDVKTQGTLLGAYAFSTGAGGAAVSTVNTVPFITAAANTAQGYVTSAGAQFAYNSFNSSVAPYINLSYNYRQVILRGLYSSAAPAMTVTLNGLTGGETYLIQLWVNDSRGNNQTPDVPQTRISFRTGTAPIYDSVPVQGMEVPEVPGKLGQYVVGYLTMGASETSATLDVKAVSGPKQINAIQIRAISGGPTAWMADAKYGIMLHYQVGGQLPAAYNPATAYAENAEIYRSPGPNLTQSEWSRVVNAFDVTNFANDAAASGAGWVIMSVGSTFGYYNSFNAEYESTLYNGGTLANGQFTPKHDPVNPVSPVNGDLINAVADALREKGIPLFVYFAAEGPFNARNMRNPSGQQYKVQFATKATKSGDAGAYAAPTPFAWSPGANADFRTKMNNMLTEWSTRWGSKVAGWWVDGCFSNTGFGVGGTKPDGSLTTEPEALANRDAMVAALKSGNPSAMVALNPGFNRMEILSANQDYIAGERGAGAQTLASPTPTPSILGDSHDKFRIYPTEQTVTHEGKKVQWHNLSFIGWTWRKERRFYVTEELISYIQAANTNGGVVTLDVDFTAAGRINPDILNQLRDVKAALKPTALPASTPAAPVPFVNLALFKPAYMRSVTADNIADPEIRVWGYYMQRANAGNDGDYRSWAEADISNPYYYYTYSYIVDLGSTQPIDRIVYYPAGHYPKTYQLDYSTNGSTWSSFNAASYAVNHNNIRMHDAGTTKNARYVRLKALTVQDGMSINEFEVYNTSSASMASDIVWIDEYIPGINTSNKTVKLVNTTGTWNWTSTLDYPGDPNNPVPQGGLRYHSSPVVSGTNEHGFTNCPAILRTSASGDSLYCWVYMFGSQPTTEILLKWTATDGTVGSARWGGASPQISGAPATAIASLPATDGWVKLSVSASAIGLANKSINGMSFSHYGGKVLFDRAGKTRP